MLKEFSSSARICYPSFDRNLLIQRLQEGIEVLKEKLPISLVVLFGSYAKGNYTAASDIDLLIVYEGEERNDAFVFVKKTLSIPLLEPHLYTESEYAGMRERIYKMIENGVIIFNKKNLPGGQG